MEDGLPHSNHNKIAQLRKKKIRTKHLLSACVRVRACVWGGGCVCSERLRAQEIQEKIPKSQEIQDIQEIQENPRNPYGSVRTDGRTVHVHVCVP